MKLWPFRKSRPRVFVLGIDGVPCSLLERFLREGRMPNLANLLGDGRLTRMNSCYPTVSNVAWACFQTGKNPGGFGVFGFAELTPDMELRVPTSKDLQSQTIWEILSDHGLRVIGLGVPLSHPPRPVNGILVGGFLAPKLEDAVYPSKMIGQLRSWGYELDVDPIKARESLDHLKGDLLRCLAGRERTILELLDLKKWDLFAAHVMETDRINHFMWKYLRAPATENGAFFLDFYRRIDDLIGRIAHALGGDAELMILSDHGFCETHKEVQLNRWLEEKQYLVYEGDAKGYASVCGRSRAVALVPGRVHILRKGRWARGCVGDAEYEKVRDRIMEDLRAWTDPENGRPICREVFRREEIFHGPYVERAPDIIAQPTDGYDLKAALGGSDLFVSGPINGMHTREDAMVFLRGRRLTSDPIPVIWDVMPTLRHLLDVKFPDDLEGRCLIE